MFQKIFLIQDQIVLSTTKLPLTKQKNVKPIRNDISALYYGLVHFTGPLYESIQYRSIFRTLLKMCYGAFCKNV